MGRAELGCSSDTAVARPVSLTSPALCSSTSRQQSPTHPASWHRKRGHGSELHGTADRDAAAGAGHCHTGNVGVCGAGRLLWDHFLLHLALLLRLPLLLRPPHAAKANGVASTAQSSSTRVTRWFPMCPPSSMRLRASGHSRSFTISEVENVVLRDDTSIPAFQSMRVENVSPSPPETCTALPLEASAVVSHSSLVARPPMCRLPERGTRPSDWY